MTLGRGDFITFSLRATATSIVDQLHLSAARRRIIPRLLFSLSNGGFLAWFTRELLAPCFFFLRATAASNVGHTQTACTAPLFSQNSRRWVMRIYYGYHGGSSRSSLLIRPVLRELLKTAGSLAASKLNEQVCVSLSSMQTLQRSTWKVETCLKSCYHYAVVKTRCTLKTLLRITPPYPAKWFWSFVRWLCFSSPYFSVPLVCLLWANLGFSHFRHTVLPSYRRSAALLFD